MNDTLQSHFVCSSKRWSVESAQVNPMLMFHINTSLFLFLLIEFLNKIFFDYIFIPLCRKFIDNKLI